jgi:hypothetical protein
VVRERAAGYMPDMELQLPGVVGRAGHGEAAARAVLQQEVEVLSGEEYELKNLLIKIAYSPLISK